MDHAYLILATALATVGGALGIRSVRHGSRSRWTVFWMVGAFLAQLAFLGVRGEQRGACPLRDIGEVLAFLAWSLTLFYLCVGPLYRVSLLGVFTAPAVVLFQLAALLPGMLDAVPRHAQQVDPWREAHGALSVLSYGALALAAVAGVMFLMLNRLLKDHHLAGGLFKNLPPVRELVRLELRLMVVGFVLLSGGILSALMMHELGGGAHLLAAVGTWAAYAVLLVVQWLRGLTPRRLSEVAIMLFGMSLMVFAFL
jgi:ABC-type uncharacterized transport system permease subunit